MTLREFYLERRKAELPIFLAVLKSLPTDRLDYKPHERSPSAEQLVWTLTSELRTCLEVVKEHRTEWRQEPPPPFEETLKHFEQWSEELIALVTAMDESSWSRVAKFFYAGKVVSEQPGRAVPLVHSLRRYSPQGTAFCIPSPYGGRRTGYLWAIGG